MDVTSNRSQVSCGCSPTDESANWPETDLNVAQQQSPITSCCKNCHQDSTAEYIPEPNTWNEAISELQYQGNYSEPQAQTWDALDADAQQVDRGYYDEQVPAPHSQWIDEGVPEQDAYAGYNEPYDWPERGAEYQNQQVPQGISQQQQQIPTILVIVVNKTPANQGQQQLCPFDAERKARRQKKVKKSEGSKKEQNKSADDENCECESKLDDCEDESNLGDLERTLENIIPNKECLSYLQSLANKEKSKAEKRKKRPERSVFDRFASPPFVIEPKPCCRSYCNRNCCYSHCNSCYNSCYPWC